MRTARESRSARLAVLATTVASLILLAAAESASAAFVAPTFLRQWSTGPASGGDATAIAADRSGAVYVLKRRSPSFRVLKYRSNGKPAHGHWGKPISGVATGGLTTAAHGHVYLAVSNGPGPVRLREYTSAGVLLASIPARRLYGSSLAADRAGHIYATGRNRSGHLSVNEYSLSAGRSRLIASAPFPGTPSGNLYPRAFQGIATDPSGKLYASGESTSTAFLLKYGPGLTGPAKYLESCTAASGDCFGGFGVGVARTAFPPGAARPMIYAGGGYGGGADPGNFYAMGIYNTSGAPSQYLGSFGPAPLPGAASGSAFAAAGSPCRGLVYTLNSVFGGPGNTFSGNAVQVFNTHAASRCRHRGP